LRGGRDRSSSTVDAYAAALPDQAREVLDTIRRLIAESVPGVRESIRYQMPVFTIDTTYLVYVGAWKQAWLGNRRMARGLSGFAG